MLIGRGKYLFALLLVILKASTIYGQPEKRYRYLFKNSAGKTEIMEMRNGLIINYNIPEINFISDSITGSDFYRLSIPEHIHSSEPGKPEMPVFSSLIAIPGKSDIKIKITDVQTSILTPGKINFRGKIFPRQEDQPKSKEKQKTGFLFDREFYNRKGFIDTDTVKVEFIGNLRNTKIANLSVHPVRYNPSDNKLEVITSMKIMIYFNSEESAGLIKGTESLPFIQTLSKGLLNYSSSDLITEYSGQPLSMIIITDTLFKNFLKPYIKWKTQRGLRITTLYRGTGLAGNTFAELKDTLLKIYNSFKATGAPPEYLLIIGDVNRIPSSEGISNTSDLYYSTFDGVGDYLPEMFTGRLPVADTTELKSVIKKLIQYEKFQFADTNKFYTRTLATAGDDAGHINYMNGQIKYAEKYYLNSSNKITGYFFYYPQSVNARDSIIKLFNLGLGFVNYSGHGDAYGWNGPSVKSDDVVKFTNKNMYPFVISNACKTGQFNLPNSFGNTLLKADEKGAVGFIGASNDSYWNEDFYWTVGVGAISADPKYEETGLGAYDRLFHKFGEKASDWYITMGQINYAGNLAVTGSTSTLKKYYWEIYNLLGDPSLIPYIGTPDTFKISIPDTLPNGLRSLSLTLEPYSYIAISHFDTLWDASYASPSGVAFLEIPEKSNDSCLIVVTGQNKVPFIKKVYINSVNKEFINLTKTEISDVPGNNDGKVDYGEKIYLNLTVSNMGFTSADSLYVKLSPASPEWYTITNDSIFIGTLNGLTDTVINNKLQLKINELIPDMSYITVNIKLKDSQTEKNYKTDIRLYAPVINILSCTIDDSLYGNGDNFADPGETLNLAIRVANTGSSKTAGQLVVTYISEGVEVLNSSSDIGILNPGEILTTNVPVTISPVLKKGSLFEIMLMADCNPYYTNKLFIVPVGKIRESFEYQTFNMFPWNNGYTYPWIITSDHSFEGYFSARSGVIPHNSESKLTIKINIPHSDSVSFMYRVSSEKNYDFLIFKLNNNQIFSVSGESEWVKKKIEIKEGFNTLEWIYKKDQAIISGSDCAWLDYLEFPPDAFNKIDLKTVKIVSPDTGKKLGQETITAEIVNLGTDTIKQFNLAYCINNKTPVTQKFTKTINPGDTALVSFTAQANLSFNGTYFLKVYGLNNNDFYLYNDTASVTMINTAINDIISPGSDMRVMPNPFSERIKITISSKSFERVNITLSNVTGKIVWEEKSELIPGENDILLAPHGLVPGYYTLRISGKTMNRTVRVIKSE